MFVPTTKEQAEATLVAIREKNADAVAAGPSYLTSPDPALEAVIGSMALNMQTRTRNVLTNAHILSLDDLNSVHPRALLMTKNCGAKMIRQLHDCGAWPGIKKIAPLLRDPSENKPSAKQRGRKTRAFRAALKKARDRYLREVAAARKKYGR